MIHTDGWGHEGEQCLQLGLHLSTQAYALSLSLSLSLSLFVLPYKFYLYINLHLHQLSLSMSPIAKYCYLFDFCMCILPGFVSTKNSIKKVAWKHILNILGCLKLRTIMNEMIVFQYTYVSKQSFHFFLKSSNICTK